MKSTLKAKCKPVQKPVLEYEITPKLFVSKLNPKTTAADLKAIFSKAGRVIDAYVIRTGKQKYEYGKQRYEYGFVTFERIEQAKRAVDQFNGIKLVGNIISVSFSKVKVAKAACEKPSISSISHFPTCICHNKMSRSIPFQKSSCDFSQSQTEMHQKPSQLQAKRKDYSGQSEVESLENQKENNKTNNSIKKQSKVKRQLKASEQVRKGERQGERKGNQKSNEQSQKKKIMPSFSASLESWRSEEVYCYEGRPFSDFEVKREEG